LNKNINLIVFLEREYDVRKEEELKVIESKVPIIQLKEGGEWKQWW